MRHRYVMLAGAIGLNTLTWGAFYFYGIRPPVVSFEPIGSPECRNIPIQVDGETWQTSNAVPWGVERYSLAFEHHGDEGTLTMTDRSDPANVVSLSYERTAGFIELGCHVGG